MKSPAEISNFSLTENRTTDVNRGLSEEQAAKLLAELGENRISQTDKTGALRLLLRQFQATVVLLLIGAALVSLCFNQSMQAAGIFLAVIINGIVGFSTELKANLSLKSLEDLSGPTASVLRSGHETNVPVQKLVPGDIVMLEPGARVPADLSLLQATRLAVDESAVTGESEAVYKYALTEAREAAKSTVLQGSLVVSGHAKGMVQKTGDNTYLGQLGQLLKNTSAGRTPLELQLEILGQQLTIVICALCLALALVGIWHQEPIFLMIQTAIALAVAAIPEGMPVVATLALAIGTHKMVKFQAIIKQLSAVETLGCTTVICSDKTGTLTENRMVVTDIACNGKHFKISGSGYEPVGNLSLDGLQIAFENEEAVVSLLRTAALCSDAKIESHGDEDWHVHGDPTEGALIAAAGKAGLNKSDLAKEFPRLAEKPFDMARKKMSTIIGAEQKFILCVKGAPEKIFESITCKKTETRDVACETAIEWYQNKNVEFASRGLRVLAIALKELDEIPKDIENNGVEENLILIGLIGMSDRPRAGVAQALSTCKSAGIKVMMVTGDQPMTAKAIAKELHIGSVRNDDVLTGNELLRMSDLELKNRLKATSILARMTPEMKLNVVKILQESGEIVAMTGDGINDAPALKQANIGVAMGRGGTALAREAASMVITDDNFTTIVRAIEEGRNIYAKIQKSISYLLTASFASVLCVALAVLFDIGLPLSPLQLLWLNLIMHVFPALGIVLDEPNSTLMNQTPREAEESLLTTFVKAQILFRSMIVAAVTLASLYLIHTLSIEQSKSTTIGFTTLSIALLLQAISWNNTEKPWKHLLDMSWPMCVNIALSLIFLLIAIYSPFLQTVLTTQALSTKDFALVAALSIFAFLLTSCTSFTKLSVINAHSNR